MITKPPKATLPGRLLSWSRRTKQGVVIALDLVLALLAMWLAFTLRLDTPHWPSGVQWLIYALAPLLAIPVFERFGLYRAIFRYTGLAALVATGRAIVVYGVMLFSLLLWLQWLQWGGVPRSVGVLQPLIFLLLVGASRALARIWLVSLWQRIRPAARRLLIYGAGSAGAQTAAALGNDTRFVLLGFVDDDAAKVGKSINGVPVRKPADVPGLVARQHITDILLALPSASRQRRNEIIASLSALPVHIRTLPGLADLASGRVGVQDFHELDLDDLLGRAPVLPQAELLARKLAGKVVLVSGAGGSIGSALCRQILEQRPRQLLLLDHNEFGLYSIHQELLALSAKTGGRHSELTPLLGNVVNYPRMAQICHDYRPDIVYHAAAYKHVPMVECNPAEGVRNNVIGTLQLARAAIVSGVAQLVLISTDKAVRPTNVMGASKRIAELVLQALADCPSVAFDEQSAPIQQRTCLAMVRFGNVLGSSGSVVPLFRRQLAAGGPLTVTHPNVTRYFMTIPEAAQLVLQASVMAQGGEVFVLDMGEPVKILELARRMVRLSGQTLQDADNPQGDIEIVFTGLRPGEKLYEELLIGNQPEATAHPRIMKAHEALIAWAELAPQLRQIDWAAQRNDIAALDALLHQLVAGYHKESP